MYVHVSCVYPAISKYPKQLPNCLTVTETSVVLIVSNGVTCDISAHTVTFFTRRVLATVNRFVPYL